MEFENQVSEFWEKFVKAVISEKGIDQAYEYLEPQDVANYLAKQKDLNEVIK